MFPKVRMRRLRNTKIIRSLIRENVASVADLIYPLFIVEGKCISQEIPSMPGIYQTSVDLLTEEVKEIEQLGIPAVLLFGIPQHKDGVASSAYAPEGVIQQAIRTIKTDVPGLMVVTDVCLCEYTDHGHCGIVIDGSVDNDGTLSFLARMAISHAEAGADMIAPSDMMDGRIGFIREKLDDAGYIQLPIMSYAAKYASAFYGPFRQAAQSSPQFGDRSSYQIDPPNANEALREVELDINEGADIVMVKPALAYLDIIRQVKDTFHCPVAAYNVSGEYSMVKAAVRNGWLDEEKIVTEILTSIKRAGADIIITYHAKEVAKWLKLH